MQNSLPGPPPLSQEEKKDEFKQAHGFAYTLL